MEIPQKTTQSWIMRSILNQRVHINNMQSDLGQKDRGKFSMKTLYLKMRCEGSNEVVWNRLLCGNPARPRALMTLWQACHGRLPTKDHLLRFGMLGDKICCFCEGPESHDHLTPYTLLRSKPTMMKKPFSFKNHKSNDYLENVPAISYRPIFMIK